MKQYRNKDLLKRPPQQDTLEWITSDKLFTITTTTNAYSKYFVYINLHGSLEWIGVSTDSLDEALEELNRMIETEEIEKYQ